VALTQETLKRLGLPDEIEEKRATRESAGHSAVRDLHQHQAAPLVDWLNRSGLEVHQVQQK